MQTPAYRKIYNAILSDVKSEGVRVFHRQMGSSGGFVYGGEYNQDTNIITINKDYKWSIEGCYILCHEYIHYEQYSTGRFSLFFSMSDNEPYDSTKMEAVIEAEFDAVDRGSKMLEKYGIKKYYPIKKTKKARKECILFWKNEYFK